MATFAAFNMSDVIAEVMTANTSRQAFQDFIQAGEDAAFGLGYADGYSDGHDDGYAEGYAQGLADAGDDEEPTPPTPVEVPVVFGDAAYVNLVEDALARLPSQFRSDDEEDA